MTDLQTTKWDNSNIYSSFEDPKIAEDIKWAEEKIRDLQSQAQIFEELAATVKSKSFAELKETLPLATKLLRQELDATELLYTIGTYGSTASSVNAKDPQAKELYGKAFKLLADLKMASKSLLIFLRKAPEDYLVEFFKDQRVNEMEFTIRYSRKENQFLLSTPEEVLIEGLSLDGFHAWSQLYNEISGAMKISIEEEELGLTDASNILFQNDPKRREKAYRAINKAWVDQEVTAAAIQSSLQGWRNEGYRARSKTETMTPLNQSCFSQRMSRETLDSMMQVTYENRKIGHEALKLMAHEMKKDKLDPWDLLAPYPVLAPFQPVSLPDAMDLIVDSFKRFDPAMGQFAQMAYEKNWIDASPSDNRKSGAFCTSFLKQREPRVFITYDGSMKAIITLAHELGHAYHNWVMKDIPYGKSLYTMSLAETASIFAENLVRDAILEKAKTVEEKKTILWQELESAASLLINIPARFDYELNLTELRTKKVVSAADMKKLTTDSWAKWYGDTLTEYNEMFWASKLHFSMSKVSFYNYPYLFGYLFSLGIYAQKEKFGADFKNLYTQILRDTGSMTPEDLINKYLQDDIRKPQFWLNSLKIVQNSIEAFKKLNPERTERRVDINSL